MKRSAASEAGTSVQVWQAPILAPPPLLRRRELPGRLAPILQDAACASMLLSFCFILWTSALQARSADQHLPEIRCRHSYCSEARGARARGSEIDGAESCVDVIAQRILSSHHTHRTLPPGVSISVIQIVLERRLWPAATLPIAPCG